MSGSRGEIKSDDFYQKIALRCAILALICFVILAVSALFGAPLLVMLKAGGVLSALAIGFFLLVG